MARPGHERFTEPTVSTQRRYEALRAYFVEELSSGEIAERFGYRKASVQTLISAYRDADLSELFATSRPGPKRQPKKDAARERVIELRRQRHGIEEIVSELERAGTPLSRTAVWEILRDVGLSRMPKPPRAPEPPPAIMSYGEDTILDKHYVPRRSQRTRSVLTFIAQDGEQRTIIYSNAELTARQQSGEVISFCRFYEKTHGELPKLLVFDGKLTTQEHLAELDELGVGFITLRQAPRS